MGAARGIGGLPLRLALLAAITVLLGLARPAAALKVKIAGQSEECFKEVVTTAGEEISGYFVTTDVYNRPLHHWHESFDLMVFGPLAPPAAGAGRKLSHALQRKTEAQFTTVAHEAGEYELCFKNNGWYPGWVQFQSHVGMHVDHAQAKVTHLKGLEARIKYLRDAITWSMHEYQYQRDKEALGRATAESVNRRVCVFAAVESAFMVAVSIFQVLTIRRLFNRRPVGGRLVA